MKRFDYIAVSFLCLMMIIQSKRILDETKLKDLEKMKRLHGERDYRSAWNIKGERVRWREYCDKRNCRT